MNFGVFFLSVTLPSCAIIFLILFLILLFHLSETQVFNSTDYLAASEEASQKPVLKAMELVWIRLRSEYGVIPDLESCDFEEIDKAPLVCYAEIPGN